MSTKLDGSEDDWLQGSAKKVFEDSGMYEKRGNVVNDVRERVAAGTLTWDSFYANIEALGPADIVVHEGAELQDADTGCDVSAIDALAEPEDVVLSLQADILNDWVDASADASAIVLAGGEVDPVSVEAADDQVQRLCELDRVLAAATTAKMQQVQWYCEQEKRKIERNFRTGKDDATNAGHLVKRFTKMRQARIAASVALIRRKSAAARKNRARVVQLLRNKKKATFQKKKKSKTYEQRLAAVTFKYTPEACGQNLDPKNRGAIAIRMAALERLRLRSPPLPDWLDLEWPDLMEWYARDIAIKQKATVGVAFLKRVGQVKHDLGMWLLPAGAGAPEEPAPVGAGDPRAFELFVLELQAAKPKSKSSVVL